MNLFSLLLILSVNACLAVIPAYMAQRKGYSYGLFWLLGFAASFLTAIIVAACIRDRLKGNRASTDNSPSAPDGSFPRFQPPSEYPPNASPTGSSGIAPVNHTGKFADRYLGIIVFGILFILVIIIAMFTPDFARIQSVQNMLEQLAPIVFVALGAVIVGRAGGLDLSIPGLIALSTTLIGLMYDATGSLLPGILLALAACLAFGFVNGVVTVFLRIPPVLVTFITLQVAGTVSALASRGKISVIPDFQWANLKIGGVLPLAFIIMLVLAAGCFLLIFLTRLGVPFPKRFAVDRKAKLFHIFAYPISALMAFAYSIFMVSRFEAVVPNIGTNINFEILTIFFITGLSILFDNRLAPVPMALVAAIFIIMLKNTFMLLGVDIYTQTVVFVICLAPALVLDRVYLKRAFKRPAK